MAIVRFSPEFMDAFDIPEAVEVDGSTVHAAIDQIGKEFGKAIADEIVEHRHGARWFLASDIHVFVNGREAHDLAGLGTPLAPEDEVVIAPRKGSARPFDNV